jgi:hypothetical protein
MRSLKLTLIVSLLTLPLLFAGCKRQAQPPAPLPVEAIPAELDKAFANAKPSAKELVQFVKSGLQKKDYSASYQAVQALCAQADSTKEQQAIALRAMLSLTELLNTAAQTQADPGASEALNLYKASK